MRLITYILFFLFSLGILGKANLLTFIKKIKSPIELNSANEVDDDENKERSEKEESKDKHTFFQETFSYYSVHIAYNCDKHILNFYKLLFKSHFKEVATPPPELV